MHVSGGFCDLEKAFDSVNHELLLYKLEYYGIQRKILDWFKSYLVDRKQRVYWNLLRHTISAQTGKLSSMGFL